MPSLIVEVPDQQFVEALVRHWISEGRHPLHPEICPSCQQELTRTAITKLAYTFEVCECGTPEDGHLVEQLWHRTCLVAESS